MPVIGTKAAASAQGFGFTLGGAEPVYIESIFSTYLYTGNGTTQTITNGIDLSGKGGLVWVKSRTNASGFPSWFDTNRGALKRLQSSSTLQEGTVANSLTAFNSDGFSVGSVLSASSENFVGWTFRKQPKFFDVVTYTGTGANRTIAHNLGSVPGCIIVKRTDTTGRWWVYHKDVPNTSYLVLNTTGAQTVGANVWNNTSPTSTVFTVGTNSELNATGGTYVAYLYANDAGGFGLTGTDNVISCGSYTGNGSATGPVVTLGYEPQWLMVKNASGTGNWQIIDSMRGMPVGSADATLQANLTAAETSVDYVSPTATGFQITSTSSEVNTSASTYIYIAIRRGPMKVPTTGTSVFSPIAANNTTGNTNTTSFPVDTQFIAYRNDLHDTYVVDRLRGVVTTNTDTASPYLKSNTSDAESSSITALTRYWDNTGFMTASWQSGSPSVYWNFRRAPGFFDEVCYTGTGVARTVAHNLGVAPELAIVKRRSVSGSWYVAASSLTATWDNGPLLDSSGGQFSWSGPAFNFTAPTESVFSLGSSTALNQTGTTHVAYLFASCAGVSKVGKYTGSGTTKQIDCGFTGGARFVLIKRTDSTGDWYVWDSARGIVAGNDPYLLLNSTAAEVTSTDYIDTASTGFEISSTAPAAINASGGSFIFLAVA